MNNEEFITYYLVRMAIKINQQDLQRRIIDNKDVQRVILNGQQIRPTSQPQINYHVVSNFSWWWWTYPWWWSWSGSAYIGWDWISSSGGQAYFDYNWFPDLSHAVKIEIIYHTYWDTANCDTNNLMWQFYYPPDWRNVGLSSYIGWSDSYDTYQLALWQNNGGQWHPMFSTISSGYYDFTWTIQLTPYTFWSTTYPWRMTREIKDNQGNVVDTNDWMIFNQGNIDNLHQANDFRVMLQPWFVVSSVDFYVYNEYGSPWPSWFHIPRRQEMVYTQTFYRESGLDFEHLRYYFHYPYSGYYDYNGNYVPPSYWNEIWFWTTSTRWTSGGFCGMWYNPNGWMERRTMPNTGMHIRLFKDYPVVPDVNNHRGCQVNVTNNSNPNYKCQLWWNSSEGLISFTSNLLEEYPEAAFWCTIQDKNRWATEVYSERTEVTSANQGSWYQRWNNYWFNPVWWDPITVTSLSNSVDVTWYGNGIYYTSPQFTKWPYSPDYYAWFTPLTTPLREETSFNS